MALNTPLRLLPDELFDRLMVEVTESFLERLKKHRVNHVNPELLVLMVDSSNQRDVAGSATSEMPEDRRLRYEMFKRIGYTISKQTHALAFGFFLISEMWVRDNPGDSEGQEEGLMIRAVTADGRQRATGIYLTRDIDNCYVVKGMVNLNDDGYVSHDLNWLNGIFAGVKQYVDETTDTDDSPEADDIKNARQRIHDALGKRAKSKTEPSDRILSKPPKINFSDN